MSVIGETVCLYDSGSAGVIKKVTASDVRWWSAITINEKPLRCADLSCYETRQSPITFKTTTADTAYELKTRDGYEVIVSGDTLTLIEQEDGARVWMPVDQLSVGMTIWTNGLPDERYKDWDWMHHQYTVLGKTQKEIAEMTGASTRTIRAWIQKLDLQKSINGKLFGSANPNYKGDELTIDGGYSRTHAIAQKKGKCSLCDDYGNTEVHHLDKDPTNTDPDNFLELCPDCHRSIHRGYVIKKLRRSKLTSVKEVKVPSKMYALTTEYGNCVCNGFVFDMSKEFA